jgi:hypothetical protein
VGVIHRDRNIYPTPSVGDSTSNRFVGVNWDADVHSTASLVGSVTLQTGLFHGTEVQGGRHQP